MGHSNNLRHLHGTQYTSFIFYVQLIQKIETSSATLQILAKTVNSSFN